jgi:plasmid stabilization system protein ParE
MGIAVSCGPRGPDQQAARARQPVPAARSRSGRALRERRTESGLGPQAEGHKGFLMPSRRVLCRRCARFGRSSASTTVTARRRMDGGAGCCHSSMMTRAGTAREGGGFGMSADDFFAAAERYQRERILQGASPIDNDRLRAVLDKLRDAEQRGVDDLREAVTLDEFKLLLDASAEWRRSAAHHFDRRFPASFRRDLVNLRAATQTPRRLRCRAGNRLVLLVRHGEGRITIVAIPRGSIVAIPRGSIVAIPRRTDPDRARADGVSEMRKVCSADARRYCEPCRYCEPLWRRNCRSDHRSVESATKGHGMAATKTAASGRSFHRRRNQPGHENGEKTGCNSKGHREAPTDRAASTSRAGLALGQNGGG